MPVDVTLPRYARIVETIQERIESGAYPPGALLPSERELQEQFAVSRPTVVRALNFLRESGWIESRHGKGRYAKGRPDTDQRRPPEYVQSVLSGEEAAGVRLLWAGQRPASTRAAVALDLDEGEPVVVRQRLVTVPELGPVELGTAYLPVKLAATTAAEQDRPLRGGLLRHLRQRTDADLDHVVQRMSARVATAEESRLLEVGRREPVLTVLYTVCDRHGRPVFAVDVVMPGSRHTLGDRFTLH